MKETRVQVIGRDVRVGESGENWQRLFDPMIRDGLSDKMR